MDAGALGIVVSQAEQAAEAAIAVHQTAQQRVTAAEKKLSDLEPLKAQRDAWAKALSDLDPNDPESSSEWDSLNSKINDANNQINDATINLKSAQIFAGSSLIEASSAKGFAHVAEAVAADDIEGAESIKNSTEEVLDSEISALESSGASTDDINRAKANKIVLNGLSEQQIYIGIELKEIESRLKTDVAVFEAVGEEFELSGAERTQQSIIKARQGLAAQYSTNSVQIRALDAGGVAAFTETSKAQLEAFDKQVSQLIGCPNGISVTNTTVTCKN